MFKKKFIIMAILVSFLAISAVSASDLNTTDNDGIIVDDTLSVSQNDVVDVGNIKTFTDLQKNINDASQGSTIVLDADYNYDDSFSIQGITINKALTIDGDGHTLNGMGQSHIVYVNASNVVLKNINFINGNAYPIESYYDEDEYNYEMGAAIQWQGTNGKLIDCYFENNTCTWDGGAVYWNSPVGTIDGCTFKANYADYGGALKCEGGENLTLMNSVFKENYANSGGAISWFGKHTGLVKNCIFEKNSAEMGGAGVIYAFNFTMINSTFKDNSAKGAGALIWDGNNGLLIDSTFDGNIANYESDDKLSVSNDDLLSIPICEDVLGGAPGRGGAIVWFGDNSTINNCKFTNNKASEEGGAIFAYIDEYVPKTNFTNCIFDVNHADSNGGAFYGKGNCSILDSTFTNNDAIQYGGAIYWEGIDGIIAGCTFSNNWAKLGGAIYSRETLTVDKCDFYKNRANYGGAIYSYRSEIYVYNSTFTENSANNDGGALYLEGATIDRHYAIYSLVQKSEFKSNNAKVTAGAIFSERDLVIGCTSFESNSADIGGAIYTYDGTVNSVIIHHYSANGSYSYSETVYYKPEFRLTISGNSSFKKNSAVYGGAIDIGVNADAYQDNMTGKLDIYEGAVFYNNTADCGGALHLAFVDSYIDRAEFRDNSARLGGAMEVVDYSTTEVFNSVFADNYADEYGGTILAQFNLGLYGNNFTAQNQETRYYTNMSGINIGEMFLKQNRIQTKSSFGIVFDSDTMISSPTKLIFENQTVLTGNNVKIAKFVDDNGNVIKIGAIKAKITKDSKVKDYLDLKFDDSVGGFTYPCKLEQGVYKVTGYVTSVGELDCTVVDGVLTVTDIVLTAKNVTTYYGSNDKFTVTLSDNKGTVISNAKVKVTIGTKTHDVTTDSKGQASVDLNLAVGDHDVTSTYDSISLASKVTVLSTVTINDAAGTYLNSKVSATFLNTDGKALTSKQVTFKVGSKTYTATTNGNGVASVNVDLGVGTYDVTATNPVNCEQKSAKLVISKADSTLTLTTAQANGGTTITATLTPDSATGNVKFTVGGKEYSKAIANGKTTLTLSDLDEGTYDVTASYAGDNNLKASSDKTLTFTINPSITINDAAGEYLNAKVTVAFFDANKKALASKQVTFKVGSKTYTATTNGNGVASVNVDLGVGTYDVTATNPVTNDQKSAKLTISKAGSATGLTVVQNGNSVTLTAALTPGSASGDVKFTVSGKEYTKAIANGKATLALGDLDVGNYVATALYDGDNNLNASTSNTVTFTVDEVYSIITAQDLTKTYGSASKLVVNLADNKGNAIANVKVNVNINGKVTPITTDGNGQATMAINNVPGTYDATITYENTQASAKITVKKATPKITAKAKSFKKSATVKKYTVTLKNNKKLVSGVTVKITVNKKTYSAKTKKGVATFKLNKLTKKGKYTATVKFTGNNCYKAAKSVKVKITVK